MNNTFFIYLLTRLDFFVGCFTTVAVFSGVMWGISLIYQSIEYDSGDYYAEKDWYKKKWEAIGKRIKLSFKIFVVSSLLALITPDTKSALVIIAGGKTLDYVEKDANLKKIPYKATEIILKKMDEYLEKDTVTRKR